jgi:hypothetical protein
MPDIPNIWDKQKLQAMMAASSAPNFDEKEWEQIHKKSSKTEQSPLFF